MNQKMHWISPWLTKTKDQVLNKFASIPGSFSDGTNLKRFVYIEGTRPDKVLLVAHADTVWSGIEKGSDSRIILGQKNDIIYSENQDIKIVYKNKNGVVTSSSKGIGIGADDRAGCAIVWKLRDLGHSILITNGEEIGCVSTKWMMESDYWKEILNNHQFVVQFDRKDKNHIVSYGVGTKNFIEYVQKETGYIHKPGGTTDIVHICKTICGINLSVGYYNEHTNKEMLFLDQFENTLNIARSWLSKPEIPKFELSNENIFRATEIKIKEPDCGIKYNKKQKIKKNRFKKISNVLDTLNLGLQKMLNINPIKLPHKLVTCTHCDLEQPLEKWITNKFFCDGCKKIF